jgi:hypothetical protein
MADKTNKARLIQVPRTGLWTNPLFRKMHMEQRFTWLYIVTGEHAVGAVPGIFQLTKGQILDRSGLKVFDGDLNERELVDQYVEQFVEMGWLEVDEDAGLMRIPGVVSDLTGPGHAKMMGRLLAKLPPSPLVDAHINEYLEITDGNWLYDQMCREL